jgi:hypothetical protein
LPGCTVHLLIAAKVLADWRSAPAGAPFPVAEAPCREAFRAGSNGPDMGYYPGGDRWLSDLAHYVRTADLARSLLDAARDDPGRAFAWGWATHVLADVWIHPIINLAVGARRGEPGRAVPFADDPAGHVAVELGLDASCRACEDRAAGPGPGAWFDSTDPGFIASAYREAYGVAIPGRSLWASLRAATAWIPRLIAYERAVAGGPGNWRRAARTTLRGLAALFGRKRLPHAFLAPDTPSAGLCEQVQASLEGFAGRFRTYRDTRLAALPALNLDTGEVEDAPRYPLTVATLRELERRRGGSYP